MNTALLIGLILFTGFILGQEFQRMKLPKIVGYLLAGVILNPGLRYLQYLFACRVTADCG